MRSASLPVSAILLALAGATIIAERAGSRYRALTNAAGEALFSGITPGNYTIHAESDGDMSDDPKVELHAKGCVEVALFRTLRITGRLMTRSQQPAPARVELQLRSTQYVPAEGTMTDADGHYELRVFRAGQYYLGINLNNTATQETPYPRWFYPGTNDLALATRIDFSGNPEVRTYDFTLPDRLPERAVHGVVLGADGQPVPRAMVTVFDSSHSPVGSESTDPNGRFTLRLFAATAYRLLAVRTGNTPDEAVSARPLDIQPDTSPLNLRLTLTQPGNAYLEEQRQDAGIRR